MYTSTLPHITMLVLFVLSLIVMAYRTVVPKAVYWIAVVVMVLSITYIGLDLIHLVVEGSYQ